MRVAPRARRTPISRVRWLTDTIHGYGGVVANLTGEGMLAFFGYPVILTRKIIPFPVAG